ncbi:hypothetical protein [Streptomyces glaucosporus]|uniref:hypothetical protein n=1 Tax=Streptomyces glaucosporus TaxID=284044 RepID=UPI0031CDF87B
MKTTTTARSVANPRRTTLAHLKDAETPTAVPAAERTGEETAEAVVLPAQTANPRRTVLMDSPVG